MPSARALIVEMPRTSVERFSKERHRPPARKHHLPLIAFTFLPNDRPERGRGYVVVRRHWVREYETIDAETRGDLLLLATGGIATAHGGSVPPHPCRRS